MRVPTCTDPIQPGPTQRAPGPRGLRPGRGCAISEDSGQLTVPAITAEGDYSVVGCADAAGVVAENDERNNCALSAFKVPVGSGGPDLTATLTGTADLPILRPGDVWSAPASALVPPGTAPGSKLRTGLRRRRAAGAGTDETDDCTASSTRVQITA